MSDLAVFCRTGGPRSMLRREYLTASSDACAPPPPIVIQSNPIHSSGVPGKREKQRAISKTRPLILPAASLLTFGQVAPPHLARKFCKPMVAGLRPLLIQLVCEVSRAPTLAVSRTRCTLFLKLRASTRSSSSNLMPETRHISVLVYMMLNAH